MRCKHAAEVCIAIAAIATAACDPKRLPQPEFAAQTTQALARVPYNPPPARVEIIPAQPSHSGAVWIDGEWSWQGRRWAWKRGRWVMPPANAKFAPWTTVRDASGMLLMAPGAWRDRVGNEVSEPAPLAVAKTLPGAIVDPSGAHVQTSSIPTK
ncbi:MAG: YXWGXW repeat-containing protein [Polyangiaceae bacterium]|nr:YXWGXW repeat-containing protein [Polyangiaceae bacterium]